MVKKNIREEVKMKINNPVVMVKGYRTVTQKGPVFFLGRTWVF